MLCAGSAPDAWIHWLPYGWPLSVCYDCVCHVDAVTMAKETESRGSELQAALCHLLSVG